MLPCIESYTKVDLRTVSFDIPPQEVSGSAIDKTHYARAVHAVEKPLSNNNVMGFRCIFQ